MIDREKVIKGLEHCLSIYIDGLCDDCPYMGELDKSYMIPMKCKEIIMRDALSLLKEQEAVKRTYRTGVNGFSIIWTCGACGSDLHPNNAKAKYCSNCGQAVKWNV